MTHPLLSSVEHPAEIPDPITIDEVMEQAQVFASAWSLLGSRFDDGSKLRLSQDEKDSLEVMVGMLVEQAILAERQRCMRKVNDVTNGCTEESVLVAALAIQHAIAGEV